MIWDSIKLGFQILAHWEIWLASFIFSLIFLILYLFFGFLIFKTLEKEKTASFGLVLSFILPTFIQVFITSMLVVLVLPIMMGGENLTSVSFLLDEWWSIMKAGFIGLIIIFALSIMPLIGNLVTKTHGISTFIIGIVVFHKIAGGFLKQIQQVTGANVNLKPDYWTLIGFVLLSWIVIWVLHIIIFAILTTTRLVSLNTLENRANYLGPIIGIIPGLVTVAIYISYVMLKLIGTSA
jgi:hypothetical protein